VANGYSLRDYAKSGGVTLGASETATVVSSEFPMSAADSLNFVVRIKTSDTTVTNAVTAIVQELWSSTDTWTAVGSQAQVSISGDGWFQITCNIENSSDEAQLPTAPLCRVVVTTGVDDAVTIDNVIVSRRF
jgi:hypothetical protein